jgi:hypothetical protein
VAQQQQQQQHQQQHHKMGRLRIIGGITLSHKSENKVKYVIDIICQKAQPMILRGRFPDSWKETP